ncbi:DUF1376 domain-containing protein [Mesorhizobium sp. M8A.F.Ca.ET.208.01.1.1]|uniref:DUF1376 domain-containing protein n=1 Tax=unclassified Mesorhizobium TaxID=325217 RepID=UPI001093A1CB|nr:MULTISPECIES: DUF1376 domain-containing protein [unclassified Mesorhizobium]TGQ92188.1 DUF1376 domain-containing protein [Mesorhizobium sp. M8A.F.Ca.ET.208.01.1.1]TGT52088.1 DUF1376 domain-containing protein [Mesorhizobium sp. M8A.F.Ca.ET.167.01.1.1]
MSFRPVKSPPWFRFHSADMIRRMEGLSAVAASILVQLFPRMHQDGEPIRRDRAALARLCGTTRPAFEKAIVELKDRGLIIEKSGGLWSEIIEIEIDHHAEKSSQSTKSVSKRWEKIKENQRPADTNVSQEVEIEVEGSPTANPSRGSSTAKGSSARAERARYPKDELVEINGFGPCEVQRSGRKWVIVRSAHDGDTLRFDLNSDGDPIPSSVRVLEDDLERDMK